MTCLYWLRSIRIRADHHMFLHYIIISYTNLRLYFNSLVTGHEKTKIWLDWIPRIFWDLGNLEISFIGLDQMIELVQTFQIVPIFCEYFWIFLNKIVFELVFGASSKSTTRYKVILYIIRFLSAWCIFWAIWRLGKNGFKPKTDQKCDFTWVKIA